MNELHVHTTYINLQMMIDEYLYEYIDSNRICTLQLGVRHGFKRGGPKPLLNLKVSRSLILIYIKLFKILIHAFK